MLKVDNLSFGYDKGKKNILNNISFELHQGQFLAILGNNGAGKSTLMKCINRIFQPQSGCVTIDGINISQLNRKELAQKIAYVAQNNHPTHILVYDAIMLGRKPYIKWGITQNDEKVVEKVMDMLNLNEFATRYLDELSGGEVQKVMLARALAQEPEFLLLDEPTSNLDPNNQHEMLHVINKIRNDENIGAAIIIHDLNHAMSHCDKFLFLKDSKVYSFGGVETVTAESIGDVYNLRADIITHKGYRIIVPY